MSKPISSSRTKKFSLPSITIQSNGHHSRKNSESSIKSPTLIHLSKNSTSSFHSPRMSASTMAASPKSQSSFLSKCKQIAEQISDFTSRAQLQMAMKQCSCVEERLKLLDLITKRRKELKEAEERIRLDNNAPLILKFREKFKKRRLSGSGTNNLFKFRNSVKFCEESEEPKEEQNDPSKKAQERQNKKKLTIHTKTITQTEPQETHGDYTPDARTQILGLFSDQYLKKKAQDEDGSPLQSPTNADTQRQINRRATRASISLMLSKSRNSMEKALVFDEHQKDDIIERQIDEVASNTSSSSNSGSIMTPGSPTTNKHLAQLNSMILQQQKQNNKKLVKDQAYRLAKADVEKDIYRFIIKEKSREEISAPENLVSQRGYSSQNLQLSTLENSVSLKFAKVMKQVKTIKFQAPGKIERSRQFLEYIKQTSQPQQPKLPGRPIKAPIGNKYGVLMLPKSQKVSQTEIEDE